MDNSRIPTIDLSPFFIEKDEDGRKKAVQEIGEACSTYGFLMASNHGVPLELMSRSLQVSKSFFASEDEEKIECNIEPGATPPAGYFRPPDQSVEKNEQFYVQSSGSRFNKYPKNPPDFSQVLGDLFPYFSNLGLLVESILNEYLDLPLDFLKEFNNDRSWDFLIAIHYYPASSTEKVGKPCHQDGDCISFVFQDEVKGLELYKNGEWISVMPSKGTIVVNIGDLLQVLSNDKLKSGLHRVVSPEGKDRYSLAFFYILDGEKWVEPLPQITSDKGERPKYKGFHFKEYSKLRLRNRTHPPADPKDLVGITHYAI